MSYWAQWSIHKFKVLIAPLKREFFTLNSKRALNSVDISLTLNMTIWIFLSFHSLAMTKPSSYWVFVRKRSIHKIKVWIFHFVLMHSAQNDKFRRHCEQKAFLVFCNNALNLKSRTNSCKSCWICLNSARFAKVSQIQQSEI